MSTLGTYCSLSRFSELRDRELQEEMCDPTDDAVGDDDPVE